MAESLSQITIFLCVNKSHDFHENNVVSHDFTLYFLFIKHMKM